MLRFGGGKYLLLEVEREAGAHPQSLGFNLSRISIIKGTDWGIKSLPEAITEGIFRTVKEDSKNKSNASDEPELKLI